MKLDLRRDFKDIYAHLKKRVKDFDPETDEGLGEPGPVRMIHVGYEYSQSAWVVVVFDKRPDAAVDGEWNSCIDENELPRPRWLAAGEAIWNGSLTLIQQDGAEVEVAPGTELAIVLGELITDVLRKASADGVFAKLPKADGFDLSVEHHEGAYGWLWSDDPK